MKGKKRMEKRQPGEDELRVQKFLHTVTDFDNPLSIMHTSAMLMNIAMHMYSMVLNKEDLQELLIHTHNSLEENQEDTVYH